MSVTLLSIEVRNGDINKALKLYKKRVEKSGHLNELRERKYYTKPTTKRRLEKNTAIRRNQIQLEEERENNRY
jgi:small subunit ribosomal protein S21